MYNEYKESLKEQMKRFIKIGEHHINIKEIVMGTDVAKGKDKTSAIMCRIIDIRIWYKPWTWFRKETKFEVLDIEINN